jgi:hypothetical protein
MGGLLIVFLMVFCSEEGGTTIDKQLETDRTSAFIHVFELLLLLENFCKQEEHLRKDVMVFQTFMPTYMVTIKEALDRQKGLKMKIIKFHLLLHFASDILRNGSMKNSDSGICESHHKTEAKLPAQNTQRRQEFFEAQTAVRHTENIMIARAHNDMAQDENIENMKEDVYEEKCKNIIYDHDTMHFLKRDSDSKKLEVCKWKDKVLHQQLVQLCMRLVHNKHVSSPISFYTQCNRQNYIFRGNPEYNNTKEPWYDWAYINWDAGEEVPAHLLLFMDLSENFYTKFKVGSSWVTEAGYYAIAHTFQESVTVPGHLISKLVWYGELVREADPCNKGHLCSQLVMFPCDSIAGPCVAAPYVPKENIIEATKWLILKPRSEWYVLFLKYMRETNKN